MRFYVTKIRDHGREGLGSNTWFAEYVSLDNLIRYQFGKVRREPGDYNVYRTVAHSYNAEDERFICTLRVDETGYARRVESREHARDCVAWRGDCSCQNA